MPILEKINSTNLRNVNILKDNVPTKQAMVKSITQIEPNIDSYLNIKPVSEEYADIVINIVRSLNESSELIDPLFLNNFRKLLSNKISSLPGMSYKKHSKAVNKAKVELIKMASNTVAKEKTNMTFYKTMAIIENWRQIPPEDMIAMKKMYEALFFLIKKADTIKKRHTGNTSCKRHSYKTAVEFMFLMNGARFDNVYNIHTMKRHLYARYEMLMNIIYADSMAKDDNRIIPAILNDKEFKVLCFMNGKTPVFKINGNEKSPDSLIVEKNKWGKNYNKVCEQFTAYIGRMETGIDADCDNNGNFSLDYHSHIFIKSKEFKWYQNTVLNTRKAKAKSLRRYLNTLRKLNNKPIIRSTIGTTPLLDAAIVELNEFGVILHENGEVKKLKNNKIDSNRNLRCGFIRFCDDYAYMCNYEKDRDSYNSAKLRKVRRLSKYENQSHEDYLFSMGMYVSKFNVLTDKKDSRFGSNRIKYAQAALENASIFRSDLKSYHLNIKYNIGEVFNANKAKKHEILKTIRVNNPKYLEHAKILLKFKKMVKHSDKNNQETPEVLSNKERKRYLTIPKRQAKGKLTDWDKKALQRINALKEVVGVNPYFTVPGYDKAPELCEIENMVNLTKSNNHGYESPIPNREFKVEYLNNDGTVNKSKLINAHNICKKLAETARKQVEQGNMSENTKSLIKQTLEHYLEPPQAIFSYVRLRSNPQAYIDNPGLAYYQLTCKKRRRK